MAVTRVYGGELVRKMPSNRCASRPTAENLGFRRYPAKLAWWSSAGGRRFLLNQSGRPRCARFRSLLGRTGLAGLQPGGDRGNQFGAGDRRRLASDPAIPGPTDQRVILEVLAECGGVAVAVLLRIAELPAERCLAA